MLGSASMIFEDRLSIKILERSVKAGTVKIP
jgi:hypothetical protein